ncbi:hypothetical protein PVK06_028111 [Gossypium arboreum]|uniref:Uncharacterized protein n=1 Tax=Gossypium arboreum TaxID=29729 RepID=A0ABR0P2C1_GOSAR|nr:hypothetical protein PVK06_028111 [Gossypium arboreum]
MLSFDPLIIGGLKGFKQISIPTLLLIMFDDITKVTGKEFTSFITFRFGTYLSCIFKHLNIPTQGDPPLATLIPLSFGTLQHAGYKKDPRIGQWVKGAQPKIHEDEDEDVGGTPDSIPS